MFKKNYNYKYNLSLKMSKIVFSTTKIILYSNYYSFTIKLLNILLFATYLIENSFFVSN